MSTATQTPVHINTEPSALELAAVALLRKVGVPQDVPIEVVNNRAHTVRTEGPTIRVRAMGPSFVTELIGGPHGRPAGLTAGDVLVAGYDYRAPLARQDLQLPGQGDRAVERLQRLVPGEIDLVTIDVRSGPGGRLGSSQANSQIVHPGILPMIPAALSSAIGGGVAGQIASRIQSSSVAAWGTYSGMPRTVAKAGRVDLAESRPNGDGVLTRSGHITVEVRPVPQRGDSGPDSVARARSVVASLPGQSWPGLGGRITKAEVRGTREGDNGIEVNVELAIIGRKPAEGEVKSR